MDGDEGAVEGGEAPAVGFREGDEVGVGGLLLALKTLKVNPKIGDVVGPELVSRKDPHLRQDLLPRGSAFRRGAYAVPDQGAFGNRTDRKLPVLSREDLRESGVRMPRIDPRDEEASIPKESHSSSTAARTSSKVSGRPMST